MNSNFGNSCEWTKDVYEQVIAGTMSEDDLLETLILFYKAGRGIKNCEGFFWGNGIEDAAYMPYDAFCEYVGEPTHRVAALMMYGWSHYKKVRDFTPLKDALIGAMTGAIECGFYGHGYEATEVFEHNMEIYDKAKAYLFIEKYSDINPKFTEVYVKKCGEFYILRKCHEERK